MWWNHEVKVSVRRKKNTWKVLTASDEKKKERCMEAYREEKRKVKKYIIQRKKKVNEHFGKKDE